ncbi:hypothetical protein D3C81_1885240 [compost metagenome]
MGSMIQNIRRGSRLICKFGMTMAIPRFNTFSLYGEALLLTVSDDLIYVLLSDPCPFWGCMDDT